MDNNKNKLPSYNINYYSFLSGAISGCITAVAFQPLEYIKTKLQQPEYKNLPSNKRNISLIITNTLLTNNKIDYWNLKKFWTGLSPSLTRSIPVAACYFGSVDYLKQSNVLNKFKTYELLHSFLIGILSRTMADVSTHPLNLIKTRYESENYKYKSILNAFQTIIKQEGLLGLYKGLVPTLLRDISYSGIYFPLYTKVKSIIKLNSSESFNEKSLFFASSALASSILACAFTQPPDVIRSHMQINLNRKNSFVKTATLIYSKNGLSGFFAGFVPRSTRRVLISVLSWTLYEKFSLKK